MAERDARYSGQLGEVTGSLQAIARLEDLPTIRQSVLHSASKLTSCVEQLTRDTQASVTQLRTELSAYQARLKQADRLASEDGLTGLRSRRYLETQIERRIAQARPFCTILLDLNGFKQVNDVHGHLAGDEVLKQFAGVLKRAFRASDVIGRWGGDEFVVILDCDVRQATQRGDSVKKWLAGDYAIQAGQQPLEAVMGVAVGIAAWQAGDTVQTLIGRDDAEMYRDKRGEKAIATPARPADRGAQHMMSD